MDELIYIPRTGIKCIELRESFISDYRIIPEHTKKGFFKSKIVPEKITSSYGAFVESYSRRQFLADRGDTHLITEDNKILRRARVIVRFKDGDYINVDCDSDEEAATIYESYKTQMNTNQFIEILRQ